MEILFEKGYLMEKISEDGKLVLYNYTDKCQFDKMWNHITLNSRGHVYEVDTGELVALPFAKFFNLSELPPDRQKELIERKDYTITEKIDGSLGIIYWYDGEWRVNTRGSFNSEQSQKAKEMLENKYKKLCTDKHYLTFLVEIIYPENRIVIDYKNEEKLVLLAIYDNESKKEVPRRYVEYWAHCCNIPIVKEYKLTFDEMFEFQTKNDLTIEGFVVRYSDGTRIKIKSKRYLEIARVLANLSPLSLWKTMKEGKVEMDLSIIPEEFYGEIDDIIKDLESKYEDLKDEVWDEFQSLMERDPSRKEIGLDKTLKHKNCMFSILDEKMDNVDKYIWKMIRPQ